MCMAGDEDYWEFFAEGWRRARKPHPCGECRRTIDPGESYMRSVGKINGDMSCYKVCAQCRAAAQWLATVCEGWLFDCVEEDLRNHVVGDERELRTRPLTRLCRWMDADWRTRDGQLRTPEAVKALTREAIAAYHAQLEAALAA